MLSETQRPYQCEQRHWYARQPNDGSLVCVECAVAAAYRKGQEDMRARADEAAIDMQKSASLFATTAECAAYNGACRDSAHAIRALKIKESPDADAGRDAPKEGGA